MVNDIVLLTEALAESQRLNFVGRFAQEQMRLMRLAAPFHELREQAERFQRLLDPLREFNRLRDVVDSLRLNNLRDLGSELRDALDAGAEFRRMTEALQPPKVFSETIASLLAQDTISSSLASIQPPTFAYDFDIPVPARRFRRRRHSEKKASPSPAESASTNEGGGKLYTGQYL